MRVYSKTCINRSCFKVETLLRKTGTFDPACFQYASLSHSSKAETVKSTLLQTVNFFYSSDKKVTWITRRLIKKFRISEKQRINLDVFVNFLKKKRFFYTLKQYSFFFGFLLQFLKESGTSEYNSAY